MRVAMLAPIAWRVPPRHFGPWELVVSLLTEGLVARGIDVTLFATADSETRATLHAVCPRPLAEDPQLDAKVYECLHIAQVFERAHTFDIIHNHYDFLPLSYSGMTTTPLVTTIHGFSSERVLPAYRAYNEHTHYVAISNADRHPDLQYAATIYHGLDLAQLTARPTATDDYLLFLGRVHPDKGAAEAIATARAANRRLLIAGIINDQAYFEREVAPKLDGDRVDYLGSVGPARRDELLGGAAALLHLIQFNEPFGLSMAEALCCGTPVIATPRGSVPELVTDGVNGFLVNDVSQAVAAVRRIHELDRAAILADARLRFSRDRMVDEYIAVYQQIIAQQDNMRERGA